MLPLPQSYPSSSAPAQVPQPTVLQRSSPSVPGFQLGFEVSDALPQRRNGYFHFGGRVARRDVFCCSGSQKALTARHAARAKSGSVCRTER